MAIFHRSRLNLAYWFALSMGSILVVFAGATYYVEAEEQLRSFDKDLFVKGKVIAAQSLYTFDQRQGQWQVELADALELGPDALPPLDEIVYARWYSARGELLRALGTLDQPLPDPNTSPNRGYTSIFLDPGQPLRQATIPVVREDSLIGYLQIATTLTPLRSTLNRSLLFLSLGVPITLVTIGLTGWFLGGMAMQPMQEAFRRLERFTADASHELRAPLATMLSNAQVALMPASTSATQKACLEEIVKAGQSMKILIDNLLFLARHHEHPRATPLSLIDLHDVLKSLIEDYSTLAAQHTRQFQIQLPDTPLMILGDAQLLHQAIGNLLDNAFKYTAVQGLIQLQVKVLPTCIWLQIDDDGVGIPDADLPHIFERFYRVDTARSRQTGGYGLGLSITQQILQVHGGRVTASSTLGQGTSFRVELPKPANSKRKQIL